MKNSLYKEKLFKRFLKSSFLKKAKKHLKDTKYIEKVKNRAKKLEVKAKEIAESVEKLISLIGSKKVPILSKIFGIAALIYLISPIDFVPDFLAFGFLDDIIILVSTVNVIIEGINEIKTNIEKKKAKKI